MLLGPRLEPLAYTGAPGVLNKVLYGEVPPRGPTPYPFIYHFGRKGTPFIYLLFKKVPLSHTYFGKSCSRFHVVLNKKTDTAIQGASLRNIILKGPYKYLNDRFPYPFMYLN